MKKFISIVLSILIAGCQLPTVGFTAFADEPESESGEADNPISEMPSYEPQFSLPGNMRGVVVRPNPENKGEEIPDDTFDDIALMGMNTAIIATSDYENIYYSTNLNKAKSKKPDMILSAIKAAQDKGLSVYLIFDVNTVTGDINALINEIHKFTLKYYCDGIILDNYHNPRSSESLKNYMGIGAGMGYENWLYDNTENRFKAAADTIRLTDNSIPVGIRLHDFSGTLSPPSGGESGKASEFTDGFADTLAFVKNKYADFALVDAPDALTDSAVDIPFEEITKYWGKACDSAELPMYVNHHNQRIGGQGAGWGGYDQLLRQLSAVKKTKAYKGSTFNSYSDLVENRLDSTGTMQKFFDDQINEETLFDDLVMHAPKSRSFSTNDSIAVFQGSYDSNFDVYLNDVEIVLNEAGNFYIEKKLSVGANHFTLKHKGKTVNYTIERRVVSLHSIDSSIANGKVLEVEGETAITISAIAYRGANVTARINGQTIKLVQLTANLDDAELNKSYARFVGKYTVPKGIIGQGQNLGNITVTADFNGYVKSATGASVKVIALPEPPPPPPPVEMPIIDQGSAGTGQIVGRIGATRSKDETVKYVRVLNNNTTVFASNTTGTENNPEISRLPGGTIDYFGATVGEFHTTVNGKRIHRDNAVVEGGKGMGDNNLNVLAGGTTGRNSFFRISLDHRSSFNVKAAGISYSTGYGGDFNVSSFNATHVQVDFDNVTSVTALPSFEHNQVFSAGKWEAVTINGVPKFRLVLQLRRQGIYAGNYASYNAEGELVLTFRNLTTSLSGMNIVIDPGHGKTANGSIDPGAIGEIREWDANIAIAEKLRSRLASMGANAHILRTDTTFYTTFNRNNYARELFNCDLFISLHCNAVSGNTSAKGTEVWYFTPFSQPLASSISSSVAGYFQNSVYKDKTSRNRGAKYSYYFVTLAQDFPSVLVELGFVTNMEDAMALASNKHQTGIANAVADGIQKYVNR